MNVQFVIVLNFFVCSIQLGMAMGGQVSRHSILHSKQWGHREHLVLVAECVETRLECGKQRHLTLPVARQAISILELVECPQELWQLTTMEEQELRSSLPTTKLAATPSMEIQLELHNMVAQAASSSKMLTL
jgi:hypothetical protein